MKVQSMAFALGVVTALALAAGADWVTAFSGWNW